ncbi:tetratricopeptide repeat protein [Synechococcus sp. PCC 7502]|uniref:site-2 protease family protein n=1 Tax=Synechococcus sp. PCC 7502 TaxID=1173263 RepID=UPI00029FDFA2|nr:site-2 protease family protein [Synechococcus sp. PCC 7502]AFY73422.1 tetratricopeptide repeat protein [Synechococcus sp. PCC 7502]
MNTWLQIFLVILAIAVIPFFLMCWNIAKITLRSVRHVIPATTEPPEFVKNTLQSTISELQSLGFKFLGYYEIEKANLNADKSDWGVLFCDESHQVYVGGSIPEVTILDNPPVNIAFSSFFADGGYVSTINLKLDPKLKAIVSQPKPEISRIQHLGFATIPDLWQKHQDILQEQSLTREILTLDPEAYQETIERNAAIEVSRLVSTKEMVWVEPDKSYRYGWLLILRSALIYTPMVWSAIFANFAGGTSKLNQVPSLELEISQFQAQLEQKPAKLSPKLQRALALGTLAIFMVVYAAWFSWQGMLIFVGVLLFHEGGHVLAMKWFGYRDVTMLFIPFLGALATARKDNASLTEKVWISLAGPLPGLIIGTGLAIAFFNVDHGISGFANDSWIHTLTFTLIGLNLFNLLPVYPLDGGQVADLLLFSSNPYLSVLYKSLGVGLFILIGLKQPLFLAFAFLIALSVPHSFRVARLQKRLQENFQNNPPTERPELIRHIFENLQQPPYNRFAFAQKSLIAKGILDIQREKSAHWYTRLGLSAIYIISLIGGAIGGLYAIFPNPQAWAGMAKYLSYIGKDAKVIVQQESQSRIEEANRKLQANPKDAKAYQDRSSAYLMLKNLPQALADANQAIKLDPKSEHSYALRGQIRRMLKDTKGEEADYKIFQTLYAQKQIDLASSKLQTNPQDISYYLIRGHAYAQIGNSTKALADFNQALKLKPQNAAIFLSRGQFYLDNKNYSQALADSNQAIKLQPKSSEAYYFRSEVYKQLGDMLKADADAKKAESFYSDKDVEDTEP